MAPLIVEQAVDGVGKPAVKGGFPAQDANPLPGDLLFDALGDEGFDGRQGHFRIAGSLGAGTVAIDTLKVAFVRDVDFDVRAAGLEGFAEAAADPRLASDELEGIQQQPFHGYIAVSAGRLQQRYPLAARAGHAGSLRTAPCECSP